MQAKDAHFGNPPKAFLLRKKERRHEEERCVFR